MAKTSREVKLMVKEKKIKLNGKVVKDIREGVRLLNILEAGKTYRMTVLKTGRFAFEESKGKNRVAKVVGTIPVAPAYVYSVMSGCVGSV